MSITFTDLWQLARAADKWFKVALLSFLPSSLSTLGIPSSPITFCVSLCCSRLDYRGFALLHMPVFQLKGLGTREELVLLLKTEVKKGIKYFSFSSPFVTMFPYTSNKGWRFSLDLLLWLIFQHVGTACSRTFKIYFFKDVLESSALQNCLPTWRRNVSIIGKRTQDMFPVFS